EATGLGVAHLARRALERLQLPPAAATAIIQGFGNVGSVAASELARLGVKVTGISDHTGAWFDPGGLDVPELAAHAAAHGDLAGFSPERRFDPKELLVQPCTILVPAAVE